MQKPRHQKTRMQLWVADNRKRLGETPEDLARLTGVTAPTVRAWESRGNPGEDAIRVLERHFGEAAPIERGRGDDTSAPASLQPLLDKLDAQADAINRLVAAIESLVLVTPEQRDQVLRAAAALEAEVAGTRPSPQSGDPAPAEGGSPAAPAHTSSSAPVLSGRSHP